MSARDAGSAVPGVEPLVAAFVEATEALVCIHGGDGAILYANPALQRFTGRTPDRLLGVPFWDVYVVPEHVELAQDACARAMATGRAYPQEGDWLTGDGSRRRVAMRLTVLDDDAGRPYAIACVGMDVTADREREARLHERAQTDPLTGIANRGALFDALRRHLDRSSGEGCGILFCDLDRFKPVNDEFGHAVGDQLLAEVAARIVAVVGTGDLVARFGGDEFVVLRPATDEAALTALAQRVVAGVAAPFELPTGPQPVGISVGVALGRPGEDPDELVARADRAMYGVKSHQRRRVPRG